MAASGSDEDERLPDAGGHKLRRRQPGADSGPCRSPPWRSPGTAATSSCCGPLLISNLVSVHVKRHIGRLSAYCGATSASSGVAAAASWLRGGSREESPLGRQHSGCRLGVILRRAKASCAAKIAAALDSALPGPPPRHAGKRFAGSDGIVAAAQRRPSAAVAPSTPVAWPGRIRKSRGSCCCERYGIFIY